MELQDKEEEYKQSIWEIYRREWATANSEKRVQLNKRMLRWQELMKNGWTASQAYSRVMQEESDYKVTEEDSQNPPSYSFWSWMRKAPFVILGLALVAAIVYSVVITGDRDALNTELESVQSVLALTQSELSSTKQTLDSTQSELSSTKQTLDSTQLELASTQAELSSLNDTLVSMQAELSSLNDTLVSMQAELTYLNNTLASVQSELGATKAKLEATEAELELYKETLGVEVYSDKQPPCKAGDASRWINLSNNSAAVNPTWRELKAFLLADPTDDEYYRENVFTCGDFAEMLHNNAEAAGIRSAFVGVHFEGKSRGHALNAFKTTDGGLVYVDCGGEGLQSRQFEDWYEQSHPTEWDKVAYVVKGKEYGLISLGQNTPLDYASYEKMKADWNSYAQKLEAHNREVEEFNKEILGKVYYIGTPEWERIEEWRRTLEGQEKLLSRLRRQLGTMWKPLSIVTSIDIYW